MSAPSSCLIGSDLERWLQAAVRDGDARTPREFLALLHAALTSAVLTEVAYRFIDLPNPIVGVAMSTAPNEAASWQVVWRPNQGDPPDRPGPTMVDAKLLTQHPTTAHGSQTLGRIQASSDAANVVGPYINRQSSPKSWPAEKGVTGWYVVPFVADLPSHFERVDGRWMFLVASELGPIERVELSDVARRTKQLVCDRVSMEFGRYRTFATTLALLDTEFQRNLSLARSTDSYKSVMQGLPSRKHRVAEINMGKALAGSSTQVVPPPPRTQDTHSEQIRIAVLANLKLRALGDADVRVDIVHRIHHDVYGSWHGIGEVSTGMLSWSTMHLISSCASPKDIQEALASFASVLVERRGRLPHLIVATGGSNASELLDQFEPWRHVKNVEFIVY